MSRSLTVALAVLAAAALEVAGKPRGEDVVNQIFLRLYRNNDIEQFIDEPVLQASNLVAHMDLAKPTVIYLHGYTGSARSKDVIAVVTASPIHVDRLKPTPMIPAEHSDVPHLTAAYLARADHNVVAVDWSPIAGRKYPSVVKSVQPVGKAVAAAIDAMLGQGLALESVHVVGHSMGAQVAGHAGRQALGQLPRITGLDPAGPFFNFLETHLTSADAKFVDTIHTDAGFYGISWASGAASFYPNNGKRVQPGCPANYELSSPEDYCSHHRSWMFYAESLRNENSFIGTNCKSYSKFLDGACDDSAKVPMGYATPPNTKGAFYLTTRSESPFGMQMEGAVSPISRRDSNNKL